MAELALYQILTTFNPCSILFRLLLAAFFGGIIGWERGLHGHVAGMRTHILVCLGASMTLIVGMFCRCQLDMDVDITRIGAQVISGIGFLGVGTILIRDHSQVTGVTTAAGLWTTAAIGLAIGSGFYWGAFLCAAIVVITMSILANVEKNKKQSFQFTRLYAEVQDSKDVLMLQGSLHKSDFSFENFCVCAPHSGVTGRLGIEMDIRRRDSHRLIETLQHLNYIVFVVTSD
ncbi:MAG: MgtC/SapB family protein [Faecousia sp.]